MAHDVRQWPDTVYPGEIEDECPEAREVIDALIRRMGEEGPSPDGYHDCKNLGRRMEGLWQLNLRIVGTKRQVRILYAPYGPTIVLFRIHKKSSPQEQRRAYDLAKARKREYEQRLLADRTRHDRNRTLH
jgi:hypothetical protein